MLKKMWMYLLFSATCSLVVGGGLWGYERLHHAAQRVAVRHLVGEPTTVADRMKELAVETVKGGPGVEIGAPGTPWAGIPLAAGPHEPVGTWDPRAVEELRQEGVDVSALNEIRAAMREALTNPDPEVRLRQAAILRQKYGVGADPALLGRLDSADAQGRVHVSLTDRGKSAAAALGSSIANLYRSLMGEIDR